MRLINYIFLVGIITGSIASLPRIGFRTLIYILIATVGSLSGALLAFGDAPWLMEYSFIFNEWTIPVITAVTFLLISLFFKRIFKRSKNSKN